MERGKRSIEGQKMKRNERFMLELVKTSRSFYE